LLAPITQKFQNGVNFGFLLTNFGFLGQKTGLRTLVLGDKENHFLKFNIQKQLINFFNFPLFLTIDVKSLANQNRL
jgi:hypothetical protein